MRVHIIRLGAFGDSLVITPVLRELKAQGHYVILESSDRGKAVFKNNPYIDEFIYYPKDSKKVEELAPYWNEQKKKFKADKQLNFSETLEVALALHPRSPRYNYSKTERYMLCNKNYYEYSMKFAGLEGTDFKPQLFFDKTELLDCKQYIRSNKFNILVCMSGSGKQKAYPYTEILFGSILNEIPNSHIITVGDMSCKLLESFASNITNLSGDVDIRTSMALTNMVDLVISPDTGILHASGCYGTPKIGLLGHTTKENITKHFENDYSIEANPALCECSPCFRLIYDMKVQCPRDSETGGAYCMAKGIPPEVIMGKVKEVYDNRS